VRGREGEGGREREGGRAQTGHGGVAEEWQRAQRRPGGLHLVRATSSREATHAPSENQPAFSNQRASGSAAAAAAAGPMDHFEGAEANRECERSSSACHVARSAASEETDSSVRTTTPSLSRIVERSRASAARCAASPAESGQRSTSPAEPIDGCTNVVASCGSLLPSGRVLLRSPLARAPDASSTLKKMPRWAAAAATRCSWRSAAAHGCEATESRSTRLAGGCRCSTVKQKACSSLSEGSEGMASAPVLLLRCGVAAVGTEGSERACP